MRTHSFAPHLPGLPWLMSSRATSLACLFSLQLMQSQFAPAQHPADPPRRPSHDRADGRRASSWLSLLMMRWHCAGFWAEQDGTEVLLVDAEPMAQRSTQTHATTRR